MEYEEKWHAAPGWHGERRLNDQTYTWEWSDKVNRMARSPARTAWVHRDHSPDKGYLAAGQGPGPANAGGKGQGLGLGRDRSRSPSPTPPAGGGEGGADVTSFGQSKMAYYFKGERAATAGDSPPQERGRQPQQHNRDATTNRSINSSSNIATSRSTKSRSKSRSRSPSPSRDDLLDHLHTLKNDLKNGPKTDLRNDPFSLFSNAALDGPAATAGPFDLTRYQHHKHSPPTNNNQMVGAAGVHMNKAGHQGDQRKKGSAAMIVLQWDTPAEVPYGTLLDHHQLNAWTEPLVAGEFVYYLEGDGMGGEVDDNDHASSGGGGGDILLARQIVSKDVDPPPHPHHPLHAKGATLPSTHPRNLFAHF